MHGLLGQIAFADNRDKFVGREKNTSNEDALFRALTDYFVNHTKIEKADLELLKKVISNPMYEDVFLQYSGQFYRGMSVSYNYLKKRIDDLPSHEQLKSEYGWRRQFVIEDHDFTYVPRHGYSSWSKNLETADAFAYTKGSITDGTLGIILCADTADFMGDIFSLDALYRETDALDAVSDEAEIFCIGNVDLHKIIIARTY